MHLANTALGMDIKPIRSYYYYYMQLSIITFAMHDFYVHPIQHSWKWRLFFSRLYSWSYCHHC